MKASPLQWSRSSEAYPGCDAIDEVLRRALRPDPELRVSEWADKYRRLSTKLAAEPGPYRTARAPYLRAIMDALSVSDPTRKVVFMKSAQAGATEAGNNWLGYIIHWAPAPVMGVWPTVEAAEKVSKQRIEPLIEESPELRRLIPPRRGARQRQYAAHQGIPRRRAGVDGREQRRGTSLDAGAVRVSRRD